MNLILRLLFILMRARYGTPLTVDDTSRLAMRVLPNDLDLNLHLNNGRYLTIMDLGRIDFIARLGLLPKFFNNRWTPVIGGTLVRYRFSLRVFQKFELTTRILGWDDKWIYIEQHMATRTGIAAMALAKASVRKGPETIPPAELLRSIGISRSPPLRTQAVQQWIAAEQTLSEEAHHYQI